MPFISITDNRKHGFSTRKQTFRQAHCKTSVEISPSREAAGNSHGQNDNEAALCPSCVFASVSRSNRRAATYLAAASELDGGKRSDEQYEMSQLGQAKFGWLSKAFS